MMEPDGRGGETDRLVLRAAEPDGAEVRRCLSRYFDELDRRFEGGFDPRDQAYSGAAKARLSTYAVLAWLDGEPVACAFLNWQDRSAAEVKRMWVAPEARGKGIARRLLRHLEDKARELGFSVIRLDTNKALPEAQALYRSAGYGEIARYSDNPYAHHWFGKMLEEQTMLKRVEDVGTVAIIGNGLMGQGIAQVFARAGKRVRLIGRNPASLDKAMAAVARNIDAFVERGLTERGEAERMLSRIAVSTRIEDAGGADHVIEAVPAVRELQIEIFGKLDAACAPDVVLGSTSGQPISLMTGAMAHPQRAVAMHFIYPAQLIPIVEVCGAPGTSPEAVQWACAILRAVGQTPALMNREVDGFIINRLQFAVLREAWSMWASGVASAEAIDQSFKLSLGRRYSVTGPIESAELGGLDIMHKFAEFLLPDLDTSKSPPAAIGDLVRAGHYGVKTGRGVYDWASRDGRALMAARADRLFAHMAEDAGNKRG